MSLYVKSIVLTLFMISSVSAQKNLFRFLGTDTSYTLIYPLEKNNKIVVLPNELDCEPSRHHYMTKSGKLYIQVDGSGKLYKVDSTLTQPERIDKTCYEGYNFYAYNFPWDNKFYSFSGWGFWKYDGGLRFFDEQLKEWFVKPLEQSVHFACGLNAIVWHDIKRDKIYLIYKKVQDSYIKAKISSTDSLFVQCFDIKTAQWWLQPKTFITESPVAGISDFNKIVPTHWGLIIEANNNFKLLDFHHNEIALLNETKSNYLASALVKNKMGFSVLRKEDLYFYDPEIDSLTSMALNSSDFIKTSEKIYEEPRSIPLEINKITIILLLCFLFASLIFYYEHKLRKRDRELSKEIVAEKNEVINRTVPFHNSLTQQEKLVLDLLIGKSANNQFTSVDELNRILGTKGKDVAIQKNIRSEVLLKLNEKFQVYAATNDLLVERERTAFDKRVYQYRINQQYLNKLRNSYGHD